MIESNAPVANASRAATAPGSPESHPSSCSMDTVGTAGDPPAASVCVHPPPAPFTAPAAAAAARFSGSRLGRPNACFRTPPYA